MRVIVTSLLLLGNVDEPGGPTSLGASRSWALPTSLKTVGHGLSGAHGAGVVTFVITSDVRLLTSVVARLPCAAWSESMTRKTGALPSRTTSPQEIDAASTAASPRICEVLRI